MNKTLQDITAAAGRVLIASLFFPSGLGKLAAPEGTIGYIAASGVPLPTLAYAAALFVEIVLPITLVLGFKVRLSAAAMALFTAVTAFGFHFELSDQNQYIHFFKNIAIAGGLMQVVAFGGGRWSVDGWLASRR
ncbi:MAG TPA: DoxX family protein [Luteimonas sp.]|nr:DoxX family protein [Luteimonas sp.]